MLYPGYEKSGTQSGKALGSGITFWIKRGVFSGAGNRCAAAA